jgi:hypothetical protein
VRLSERLSVKLVHANKAGDTDLASLLREAAALARRVEDGHDVLVTHWEQAAFAVAGKPVPCIGSIVRLVPEAGQEVGK